MVNYDDITLSEGDTIKLMGDIRLIVADNETLRFAPAAELTEPGTYEVRGAVRRQGGNRSDAIVWNASNFAAFWYDIDSDASTETLEIAPGTLSGLNRTIGEGNLSYATHPVYREYVLCENEEGLTVDGREGYLIAGWAGRQCVAINGRADKLCELLVELGDTDKKTLATGEAWYPGGGFALTARQIDLNGTKVWFSLYKDGKELDSEIVSSGGVYTYTPDIGGEDEVPVFACYVDAIFRGTDTNLVQVKYVFLIDDDMLEIDTGDRFGCMEVVAAGADEVVLENNETINLGAGTVEQIMEDMYFKIADDSDLRFYPFVERTISGDELTPPAEPEPATNVTIRVGEGIVLNNDIHIDLLDVDSDMGWYARVRFYSYRDSVGKTETLYQGDTWPASYTSGTGRTIDVVLDSAFSNGASFVIESSKELRITERYNIADQYNVTISAADTDDDGVPDVWDMDNSTPAGYWINSDGIGRRWGDMNGDGKLTSADALMILQAAVGSIELTPTENVTLRPPKPIYLDDFAFTPKNPTIRMGEALNWINLQKSPMVDFVLVSEERLWDNQTISYGKKFKYTFNTAGSYTYCCPGYGSAMRGTVTVLE
jgi:S-layer protein (TIGR01567 family)